MTNQPSRILWNDLKLKKIKFVVKNIFEFILINSYFMINSEFEK